MCQKICGTEKKTIKVYALGASDLQNEPYYKSDEARQRRKEQREIRRIQDKEEEKEYSLFWILWKVIVFKFTNYLKVVL